MAEGPLVKVLYAAAALALVSPAAAHAAGGQAATMVARDLPLSGTRTLAVASAPSRFNLVGLHWQGHGPVWFRTRRLSGRWSRWQEADPDTLPDRQSPEFAVARRWQLGGLVWTGPSDRIAWRTSPSIRRLRAFYVWSPVVMIPSRTVSVAGSPAIIPRAGWQANEKIRRGPPAYALTLRMAVIHHTASSNNYTPAESAAIVRGIELYHVKANGWNDIGYNFLVDRYGQIFEGRYGGMQRSVIGAHAEGFNTGSTGIAVIGNFTSSPLPASAQNSLVKLLAWRLDIAHVDPVSKVLWTSYGNPRFAAGRRIQLRAVSGHRDTGYTECPGNGIYSRLNAIAARAERLGLPKLYSPSLQGRLGGPIRFSARLSSPLAWTVTVTKAGVRVAQGSGFGATVSWTWSSPRAAASASYVWTIEAGPSVRPASGVIGRPTGPPPPPAPPPPPLVQALTVSPADVSPNGDGYADTTTIGYVLSERAQVTATITDQTGVAVATLYQNQWESARRISFSYAPDALPDGRYILTISGVTASGRTGSAQAQFSVDRSLTAVMAQPPAFSPNGDGVDDTIAFSYQLARQAYVTVQVVQNGTVVASVFAGTLDPGSYSVSWDGQTVNGPAPPGHYEVVVTAVDDLAEASQQAGFDVVS
jgi:flagellar hook assembly protein FlgD